MVASNLTDKMKSGVYTADAFMGAMEAILLAVVGRAAAWVASIPCAVITAKACATFFELTWPWAMAVAVALELVGQTTSNLWLNAKEWNANKRQSDPAANEGLALALMICYFITDFAIIAMLTIPPVLAGGELSGLTALLFPVLAVVSVIALNERVTQYKREADVAQEKAKERQIRAEKRQEKAKRRQVEAEWKAEQRQVDAERGQREAEQEQIMAKRQQTIANLGKSAPIFALYKDNPALTQEEAGQILGISRQSVSYHLAKLEKAELVRSNGRGVEVLV